MVNIENMIKKNYIYIFDLYGLHDVNDKKDIYDIYYLYDINNFKC
jgi:hypothetical protein